MKDRPIFLLAVAQTLVWACLYYSFPALLLQWEAALGWSRADLTAAITLALLVSAAVSPLAGQLIDRGLGPAMMALCAAAGGALLLMLRLVEQLWQFYLLWALIGVSMSGALYEPCFALITRARGARARRSIVFVTLMAGFAGTLSFPLAQVFADAFGWQGAVTFFGLVAMLVVTPIMWLGARAVEHGGEERGKSPESENTDPRRFWHGSVFWCLGLAFGFGALLHGVTLHHLLPILAEREVHPDVAVMAISFIGPMQVAGRLAMMVADKRVSNHVIAVSCFTLMGGAILLLIGAHAVPVLLVGFVILFGGAYGLVSIVRPVIARDLLGEQQFGAKSGALAVFYLIGSASAPFLGSLVWSRGGYELVLPGLVLLSLIGLILYLIAQKRHSQASQTG